MDLIAYTYFEYFLRDFLLAFDEEIVQCVVQFARKVTTILIFVLCVHKKIWVCHKTSSMSNLNNVYARSLQHVKFGRTPCNFIFMRNHVFFFILEMLLLLLFPAIWQRYTYRVLQTIQMKLILLCVWAEPAVLGSTKTALKFK